MAGNVTVAPLLLSLPGADATAAGGGAASGAAGAWGRGPGAAGAPL